MCQFDPFAKVRLGRTALDHYEAKRTRASLCHMLVERLLEQLLRRGLHRLTSIRDIQSLRQITAKGSRAVIGGRCRECLRRAVNPSSGSAME